MSSGYVYVLSNESMPGLVKIGMTKRDRKIRTKELYTTGVPTRFKIEFEVFCEDRLAFETAVHDELIECRVNEKREFFKTTVTNAITVIKRLYKPSPEDEYLALDFTLELTEKYPGWLREDIDSIRLVQSEDRVWLEIKKEKEIAGYLVDQIIHRTDLGFITDGSESDNFSSKDDISINVRKFIDEYDAYSIVMTTDLFSDDACNKIVEIYKTENA
ncbi:MAG: GIY-YIG nuclease family protein [Pseudomonadota bacterium]